MCQGLHVPLYSAAPSAFTEPGQTPTLKAAGSNPVGRTTLKSLCINGFRVFSFSPQGGRDTAVSNTSVIAYCRKACGNPSGKGTNFLIARRQSTQRSGQARSGQSAYTRIHEKQDNCLVLIAPTARWILRRRTDAQSAVVPIKISLF